MQFEGQLIAAAVQSRDAWDKIAAHFDPAEFSAISKVWLPIIEEWYRNDPNARSIDKNVLIEQGRLRVPAKKHQEVVVGFMRDLPEAPSAENLVQVALEFKRHAVSQQLSAALVSGNENLVSGLLPQYTALREATALPETGSKQEWRDALPVERLLEKVGSEKRIAIAPGKLNERVAGGALPGHSILVFARPEEGKSTFVLNMGGSFVRRQIRTMLVGNEDDIDVLKLRMVSRLTGMTQQEIEADKEKAFKLFRDRGGEDYLLMTQLPHGRLATIARRIEEWRPQVLIVDQIRNLHSASNTDGMTTKLEALGIEWRDLLIENQLIGIAVTQANPPHGKLWLGMEDIDSSKTGLPAQFDLIIGLNSNDEMKAKNERAVSLPKNKLSSAEDAHEGFIISIDKHRSRVT